MDSFDLIGIRRKDIVVVPALEGDSAGFGGGLPGNDQLKLSRTITMRRVEIDVRLSEYLRYNGVWSCISYFVSRFQRKRRWLPSLWLR